MMLRLGWFSTGRGQGSLGMLRTVVKAINKGDLDARIDFVFSNRELGEASGSDRYFRQVQEYGIPLLCKSSKRFQRECGTPFSENRETFDRQVIALIKDFKPDLLVLAGYMLIISPLLCNHLSLINLHPALPNGPSGTWKEVIWDLITQKATTSGAMVHLVTENVDEGAPLSYVSFPVRGNHFDEAWQQIEGQGKEALQHHPGEELPLFQFIREAGVIRERPLLLETLKALATGKLSIINSNVVTADGKKPPLCLNQEVESVLGHHS